jgi:hypothetical protein
MPRVVEVLGARCCDFIGGEGVSRLGGGTDRQAVEREKRQLANCIQNDL